MRKLFARLGVAALIVLSSARLAEANANVLKPFVVMILDTSGSMAEATGSGPPSCGGTDDKLNHARCAIGNIVDSFGDIIFALGRFRMASGGTTTATTCPTGCTLDQDACTQMDDRFELLTALVDGSNAASALWVNFTCNGCANSSTDPEIWNASGSTPIEGSLKGAKRYWQGLQAGKQFNIATSPNGATETGSTATYTTTAANTLAVGDSIDIEGVVVAGYNGVFKVASIISSTKFTVTGLPTGLAASGNLNSSGFPAIVADETEAGTTILASGSPGFAPIANDPTNGIFFPNGCNPSPTCTTNCCSTQCRPYITILLTDGDETCSGSPSRGAANMLKTTIGADSYRVETKPIGFGITAPPVGSCSTTPCNGKADGTACTIKDGNGTTQTGTCQSGICNNAGAPFTGCQIEDIAHAGGAVDNPATLEGFYAADQAGVELAVSEIIAGASRAELCNGLDDDCDGKIDEDFPTKGQPCNNGLLDTCAVNGVLVCKADGTGLVCNAGAAACASKANGAACTVTNTAGTSVAGTCQAGDCVPTPGVEVCNGLDDNCNGLIDEGLSCQGCIPQPEICNGKDDDCDGIIDEDTDVPCGINVGVCTTGVQKCVGGVLQPCTGKQPCGGAVPCNEICNGLDDNCDGVTDGLQQACSTLSNGFPAGDPRNNPGDPASGAACASEPAGICACHPGEQVCPPPPTGNGTFGPCQGEVKPAPSDPCDGIDNDCDGKIDEDFQPAACGGCGGITQCINGVIQCTTGSGSAEICNGLDDDCDGKVDEGIVDGTPCVDASGTNVICGDPCNSASTCGGKFECVNGAVQCAGGVPVGTETCNCKDDDCDGKIDEGNVCPPGETCTTDTCECAAPCTGGEFPCPLGKICNSMNLCVSDPCFGISCPQSPTAQTCVNGACVDTCTTQHCAADEVCLGSTGQCQVNDCTCGNDPACTVHCTATQVCVGGQCTSNPCAGVTCDAASGQYCVNGQCVLSCADVKCASNQRCVEGVCQADPCSGTCINGQVCNDSSGTCTDNPCNVLNCPQGQFCNPNEGGKCETDPCTGTMCPSPDQQCVGGTCNVPPSAPDAGNQRALVTTGGGGCSTDGDGAGLLVGLALIGLVRRRRS